MPLPFLDDKKNKIADVITASRRPDESKASESDDLETLLKEFNTALSNNDMKAAAMAFRAAFECCSSDPQEPLSDGE